MSIAKIGELLNDKKKEAEKPFEYELVTSRKDFKIGDMIGGGAFSRIYEGTLYGKPVAIKIAFTDGRKHIHKEAHIYETVSHPNILPALGVHFGLENVIFLELRKYNLREYMLDYGTTLKFQQLKHYCIQVADGMKYLHKNDILHCGLKIDNILVRDDKAEFVEISDFGHAVDLQYDRDPKYSGIVTHTAYELLKNFLDPKTRATPSKACDVWGFAVTAWQIFQKDDRLPVDFTRPQDIITNYEDGKKLPTPITVSPKFWRYIFYPCLDLDPRARPSMDDLYKTLVSFYERPSSDYLNKA